MLFVLCVMPRMQQSFMHLPQAASYAHATQEFPNPDNADWQNPDFTGFYKAQAGGFKQKIFSLFGRKKLPFDERAFQHLLASLTERQKHLHVDATMRLQANEQDNFVIFSDVRGAYHSLVRGLQKLVELDLLHEDLSVSKNTYIIFSNLINASAFNLETLMLVLSLMEKNPERVIYLAGSHERSFSDDATLSKQLNFFSTDAQKIAQDLQQFFRSLAQTLLITSNGDTLEVSGKKVEVILENAQAKGEYAQAIIAAHDDSRTLGLKRYIGPPITWTGFSSPTSAHRRLLGFSQDAFILVQTGAYFSDWLITLYAHDLQKKSDYEAIGSYNLSTGLFVSGSHIDFFDAAEIQKMRELVAQKKQELTELEVACKEKKEQQAGKEEKKDQNQEQVFSVATTIDLSKSARSIGKKIQETILKSFEQKNKETIRGITFHPIILDNEYSPELARKQYLDLVENDKLDTLLAPFGTMTIAQSLDLLKNNKMALFFPAITESSLFRSGTLKNTVSLSVSYREQGKALVNFLLQHYAPKKIALFYQNDDFGKDGLQGALDELRALGYTGKVVELPHERTQLNFKDLVDTLVREQPDAIGFFCLPIAAIQFLKSVDRSNLSGKILFGISDLRDYDVLQFIKESGQKFLYANSLPDWRSNDLEIAREYRKFAEDHAIVPDPFSFEVYVIAQLFFYLVEQTQGTLTKEKLLQAAEQIKNVNFKGLELNFDPKTRVLLDVVWLAYGTQSERIKVPVGTAQTKEEPKEIQQESQPLLALRNDVLLIGSTGDLSKGLKSMTEPLRQGMDLKMREINESGGVNGVRLQLAYLDDGYIPEAAKENVEKLLKDYNTNLLMACVGTPTLESYLSMVKEGKVSIFFPFTGAGVFRNADLKNLLFFSPSNEQASTVAAEYIQKEYGLKRWALLYQNDLFGIPPKDAVKKMLEQHKNIQILEVSFARNDVKFSKQVQEVLDFNTDVIGFFGPAIAAQSFISVAGVKPLASKIMFGLPWLAGNKLQVFLHERGLKIIIPCVVPNPNSTTMAIAEKYKKALENSASVPDPNGLEGYINVSLFAYLLSKVEGTITVEKLMHVAQEIKNLDFEGLALDFDPKTRVLSHNIWLDLGDGSDWIRRSVRADS